MNMEKKYLTFKIISIGSLEHELSDEQTILNRPCVKTNENKTRWGNSYLIFKKIHKGDILKQNFIGYFNYDKNKFKQLKLTRPCEIPINEPDYFVICIKIEGEKVDPMHDFFKMDKETHSQIFSNAFYEIEPEKFVNECIILCKHGDEIVLNCETYRFSVKKLQFERV